LGVPQDPSTSSPPLVGGLLARPYKHVPLRMITRNPPTVDPVHAPILPPLSTFRIHSSLVLPPSRFEDPEDCADPYLSRMSGVRCWTLPPIETDPFSCDVLPRCSLGCFLAFPSDFWSFGGRTQCLTPYVSRAAPYPPVLFYCCGAAVLFPPLMLLSAFLIPPFFSSAP